MDRVILWDFDGTLAFRPGLWTGAILEALDTHKPGHGIQPQELRPFLQHGFPWHRADIPHPQLLVSETWWASVEGLLARAITGLGFPPEEATELAKQAHFRYIDPYSFRLFIDTHPALTRLANSGWRHILLSNHVPELWEIVEGIGLANLIGCVLSSAKIGFDKPHPEAFATAVKMAGNPEQILMVGDNPDVDVLGAEAVGIPAILVRRNDSRVRRYAPDLNTLVDLVELGFRLGRLAGWLRWSDVPRTAIALRCCLVGGL